MAEEKNENYDELAASSNNKNEEGSAKLLPAIEEKNILPKTEEPEIMEVHHHPDIHHNPKKWKEYFIEFLMIFLAVTLGFFAENLREHFVENERAKQYAQSLYDDLKMDTLTLQRTHNEKAWIQAKFDSAKSILFTSEMNEKNEFLYYIERYLRANDVFSSQDITYQQLRSSGNFRYFKKTKLYKDVCDYYNLYTRYQSIDGVFGIADETELLNIETNIFDLKALTSLTNPSPTNFYNLVVRPTTKLEPIKKDINYLKTLYVKLDKSGNQASGAQVFLNWLKFRAVSLLNELKTEYDLQ